MDRSRWQMVGISVTASLTLIWSLNWFVKQLIPDINPGELAYKPVEDMPPLVDLVKVQRDWPAGPNEPGDRNRLIAYRRDMAAQAPDPVTAPAAGSVAAAAPQPLDLGALLASADANSGKTKARVCASCHDFAPDGPDRIGPNLWGVVGRDVASRPGFAYSNAMAALPGGWNYDRLFTYLASPARAVPGTRMSFAGMGRPEDRAAVVKYLATLGGSPPPLPKPLAAGQIPVAR